MSPWAFHVQPIKFYWFHLLYQLAFCCQKKKCCRTNHWHLNLIFTTAMYSHKCTGQLKVAWTASLSWAVMLLIAELDWAQSSYIRLVTHSPPKTSRLAWAYFSHGHYRSSRQQVDTQHSCLLSIELASPPVSKASHKGPSQIQEVEKDALPTEKGHYKGNRRVDRDVQGGASNTINYTC